jgi:hypothetical protein
MASDFSVAWQCLSKRTIGFSLRVKLHALIRLGVSPPSFDTSARNGVLFGLDKAINHWRKLAWLRFEPGSPKWHTGALSTTPRAHAQYTSSCSKIFYTFLQVSFKKCTQWDRSPPFLLQVAEIRVLGNLVISSPYHNTEYLSISLDQTLSYTHYLPMTTWTLRTWARNVCKKFVRKIVLPKNVGRKSQITKMCNLKKMNANVCNFG